MALQRLHLLVSTLLQGTKSLASDPHQKTALFGFIADKFSSRQLPLLVGLLPLTTATILLYIGSSIGLLIAGRILRGISCAMVWTVGIALLVESVGQDHLGQALGYVSMAMTIATSLGPLLGGLVYDRAGYESVYIMAFALIALDLVLRLIMIEKKTARKWTKTRESRTYGTMYDSQTTEANRPFIDGTHCPEDIPTSEPCSSSDDLLDPSVREDQSEPTSLRKKRLPPALELLTIPRILVCLLGCFIYACLITTFDAVRILFLNIYSCS